MKPILALFPSDGERVLNSFPDRVSDGIIELLLLDEFLHVYYERRGVATWKLILS
jgi:hypothetical protein